MPTMRHVTDADIGYWPDLAKYITAYAPYTPKPENWTPVHISLECLVCRSGQLKLPSWVTDPDKMTESSEELCVLPCGHFLGFDCMQMCVAQSEADGRTPSCPKCRLELTYTKCKHEIPLRAVPELDADPRNVVQNQVPYARTHRLREAGSENDIRFKDTATWNDRHIDGTGETVAYSVVIGSHCQSCEKELLLKKLSDLWHTFFRRDISAFKDDLAGYEAAYSGDEHGTNELRRLVGTNWSRLQDKLAQW
ncbi:Uu.00g022230.m01.CDS01 [Anthostomella pinea]|uniref:Uu.00g022230.m01.CDS01 n=1 Tax=Anthostomella pinea TaxID=933095 RepID=A0AAI8YQU9_9PEZI|nr:Uu.00g022230.m01.CDS01 [Anthostomella pinea]